ncbi:MAG: hypothetical protein ABI540_06400 [Spartobacteria bacterium]
MLLLAAALFLAPRPGAQGQEKDGSDFIADELPRRTTLNTASKPQFLEAVCAAVRQNRGAAAAITHAAVTARREATAEIMGAVLRCSGKLNCELVGAVAAAATAAGGDPTLVADAAVAKSPNCVETIREATRRDQPEAAPEQTPVAGTSNGADEEFDPKEKLEIVCDGKTQRALRASEVEEYLRTHPGAFLGRCESAPKTNR